MSVEDQRIARACEEYRAAQNAHDAKAVARAVSSAVGFGYRTAAWRDLSAVGEEGYAQLIEQWLGTLEYCRLRYEELHTRSEGDVGLAWGVGVEDFKRQGQPPERARTRFSMVFKRDSGGWHQLLFHRDIQPFDAQGRYLTELTVVSPEG